MGKVLLIDINKCNGCYNCQIACKDEHVGIDWMPYAKSQPDTGHFWNKVTDMVRGTTPKVRVSYLHDICQHCDDAPCMKACRENAIYKRDDGIVIIDPEKCRGHRLCIKACPYGAIYFNEETNIAQKCTFCAHLLDKGWKEPRCVDACPTGAFTFGEEEELKDAIGQAEALRPELSTKPRVYYLGIPKPFVAGAVYDPGEDECIEGALVTLTDKATGDKHTSVTDNFGDFWLENLKTGTYSLAIEKQGYSDYEMSDVSVDKDINLGDIELSNKG